MTTSPTLGGWTPFSTPSTSAWQICTDLSFMLDASTGSQLIDNFRRTIDDIFSIDSPLYSQLFPAPFTLLNITQQSADEFQAFHNLLNVNGPIFRAIDRLISSEPNLRYSDQSMNSMDLNPFEYYFLRFAKHLLDAANIFAHVDMEGLDCVYTNLLIDYLNNYLPADGIFPMPASGGVGIQKTTNYTVTHDQSDQRISRFSMNGHQFRGTPYGLFRRELFGNGHPTGRFASQQTTRSSDVLWKSSALLSILFESWLNVADQRSRSSPTYLRSGNISGVVALVTRILIEHVHNFAYGPSSSIMDAQFRDFKERCVPKLLDSKMWIYLQYAFEKWPLDSSFRLLLELWLTYIQPWKYAGNFGHEERNYDLRWEFFISDHVGFYNQFFQMAIDRLIRMDLTSSKNAFTLYRLSAVFNQPGLTNTLGWIGRMTDVQIVAKHASEASKFCQDTIIEQNRISRQQSWINWILKSLFNNDDTNAAITESERTRSLLDASIQNLENAFGFKTTDMVMNGRPHHEPPIKARIAHENLPDCKQDDDGRLKLTPLGRKQLLNANRRFDLSSVPYPKDLRPIDSSIELPILANALQILSSKINASYGKKFEILYRQPRGTVPWMMRKCLQPPTRLSRRNSPVLDRKPTDLGTRLNLRPLASYSFLCKFILVFIMLAFMIGFKTVSVLMIFMFMVMIISMYLMLNYHPAVRYLGRYS